MTRLVWHSAAGRKQKTHVERSRPRLRFYPFKNRREKNLGLGKSTSTQCLYLPTPDSLIFATILEGFNRSRGRLRSICVF